MQSEMHTPSRFTALNGLPAVWLVSIWLAFAFLLLAFYYPAAFHLIQSGENPLQIIRQDAGTTRLEIGFWLVLVALVLSIGLGLPWRWFNRRLPVIVWIAVGLLPLALAAVLQLLLLPYGAVSLQRSALGILGAAVTLLAGWMVGYAVLARWRLAWPDVVERRLFECFIGCEFLSLGLLGLAFAGLYTPAVVRILTAVLSVLAVISIVTRLVKHRTLSTPLTLPRLPAVSRWWLAVIAAAALIVTTGALAPETGFDALWYHLWLPKVWLLHGRPVDIVSEYISLYPLGWELLYGSALVWGGAVAAKVFNLAALVLLGLLTSRLARRWVPGAPILLAAALLLTTPTLLWEATTAYNELGLAIYCLLSVIALAHFLETRSTPWLVLAALALGMALAVKHLGLFFLALLAAGLFVLLWRRDHSFRPAVRAAALLVGVSLVIPLPWYFRAAAASGNPVFPELYRLFGAIPPQRWDALTGEQLALFNAHFGTPRTIPNLLALPWNMTVHAWRYGGTLGPLFLLLIPALLLDQRKQWPVLALSALSAGYILLWASPLSSFQMRFLVPLVPFLVLLAVQGYHRLRLLAEHSFGRAASSVLQAGVVIIMLLNLPPLTVLQDSGRQGWNGWLTHVIRTVPVRVVLGAESEDIYLSGQIPSYRAWQYLNTRTAAGLVLTFMEGDHFYSTGERLSVNAVQARPAVWAALAGQEQQARLALKQLGVSYILFDRRNMTAPEISALAITQPDFVQSCLSLEFEDRYSLLYRLKCEE